MTAMLKTLRDAEFSGLTIAGGINSIKTSVKTTLNKLWPPAVVGFGLLITAIWSGGLAYFVVGELLELI